MWVICDVQEDLVSFSGLKLHNSLYNYATPKSLEILSSSLCFGL